MGDVARHLRVAREKAGLTIEGISARTKIAPAFLRAIESGDFAKLPGDFYTRAFLRTYARELHLNPDEITAEYEVNRTPPQPWAEPTRAPSQQPAGEDADAGSMLIAVRDALPQISWPALVQVPQTVWSAAALTVVVLILIAVVRQHPPESRHEAAAVVGSEAAAAAQTPTGTSGRAEAPPAKLTVEIRPTGMVWVAATADGNNVIYRLLKPGEHVIVDAARELSFRIGNAAAFSYAVNGVPGKPLGAPDQVREFEITRDNYRTFQR